MRLFCVFGLFALLVFAHYEDVSDAHACWDRGRLFGRAQIEAINAQATGYKPSADVTARLALNAPSNGCK